MSPFLLPSRNRTPGKPRSSDGEEITGAPGKAAEEGIIVLQRQDGTEMPMHYFWLFPWERVLRMHTQQGRG